MKCSRCGSEDWDVLIGFIKNQKGVAHCDYDEGEILCAACFVEGVKEYKKLFDALGVTLYEQ